MKSLTINPKNPRHFIALCFIELKHNPDFAQEEFFVQKIGEKKDWALFKCSHGFFWAHRWSHQCSQDFYKTLKEAVKAKK